MAYKIMIMGASYGSLLASKMLFGGHKIHHVCLPAEADLIVVGNRGMTGARRFVLGSVPNKLSHNSPASLLIVDTSTAR